MGPPVTIVTYEALTVRKRGILECPFPRLSAKLSVPFHKNPVTDCRMPPFWAPIQRKRKAIIWHKFLYHDMLGKSILQLTVSFGKERGGTKINLHTFIYIIIIGRKILSLLGFSTTTAYLLVHRPCVISQSRESIYPFPLPLPPSLPWTNVSVSKLGGVLWPWAIAAWWRILLMCGGWFFWVLFKFSPKPWCILGLSFWMCAKLIFMCDRKGII